MSGDLNYLQRLWSWDDERYRAAGERREQHARKVAEVNADITRQLNLRPHTPEENKELTQIGRELRSQERIVRGIERLMARDLDTYYSRGFDKHYARLTGASTN
jgi:hypothetical protein